MTAIQEALVDPADDEATPDTEPEQTPPVDLTTRTLLAKLQAHYRKPGTPRDGCILITEPQAPGGLRRCDLIHIGVASRGRGIDGHELKVTRADWLRELADPAKAEAWWRYCSRWWIVAPPGVVHDGELPSGWGLMEPTARRRFLIKIQAATREPRLTMGLLAVLLARADNERLAEMEGLRNKHNAELYEQSQKIRAEKSTAALDFRTRKRLDLLAMVETALGTEIDEYAWAGDPQIKDIRPAELAAALADVKGHVQAQRLQARTEQLAADLRKAAQLTLTRLEASHVGS